MARFFDIDAANAAIPEVSDLLLLLKAHRQELIELRDQVLERQAAVEAMADAGSGRMAAERREAQGELRRLRLRMQGLIDQMQAAVARIDEMGITLREIESGLIDFPALVNGRQIWLCWRLGEGSVEWWHELSSGFAGRKPLAELA